MNGKKDTKRTTIDFDIEVWKELKKRAVDVDMNLKDYVNRIAREYLGMEEKA